MDQPGAFSRAAFVLACTLLPCAAQTRPEVSRPPSPKEIETGQRMDRVLAKPLAPALRKADFPRTSRALHSAAGLTVIREHASLGGLQLLSTGGAPVEQVLQTLRASGLYEYAEPDYLVHADVQPNDPRLASGELWGLHNTGQNSGTTDADIDAPEAWDIRHDAPDVVVAVIDTGVRYTHEDIAGNMWRNPGESGDGMETNGVDDDGNGIIDDVFGIDAVNGDGDPIDDQGHGSHCAGTIAAAGNNTLGISGVAWQARIMACKFLSEFGWGTTADAIACIEYATEQGADIMSNSWGGGAFSQALLDAIAAARADGIVFVASAGNSSADNDLNGQFPSSYEEDNIVSVASTTRMDELSSFSSYGFGQVEIAAPGSDILSLGNESDSDYTLKSGTSMAGPHVSGVMALLKAQFPTDSYRQLIHRLMRGADPVPALNGKVQSGGRLNAAFALTSGNNAPPNDAFAAAPVTSLRDLYIRSSNSGASHEPEEPAHAADPTADGSVWWRWTATTGGAVSLSTAGSGIDTVLAVYTGTEIDALTEVASNDNDGAAVTYSRVSFAAQQGLTYSIAVAGRNSESGRILLRLGAPPANDDFVNAATLAETPVSVDASNRNSSREAGEPQHAGVAGGASLWWRWTAPDAAEYSVSLTRTSVDTLVAVYTGTALDALTVVAANDDEAAGTRTSRIVFTPAAGQSYYIAVDGKNGATGGFSLRVASPPANDAFASGIVIPADGGTFPGSNIGASREPGEPGGSGDGGSVWWKWTAPYSGRWRMDTNGSDFDTLLGVHTGAAANALTTLATDDDGGEGLASRILLNALVGTEYAIAVSGYAGSEGILTLHVLPPPPPAVNDNFAERIPLASGAGSVTADNSSATRETGEPYHAGNSGGGSLWWSWTAPSSGKWEFNTAGSEFDTLLGVYQGASVSSLSLVRSDDNSGGSGTSRVVFDAIQGQDYAIAVDGSGSSAGFITLTVRIPPPPPPNDDFAAATALPAAGGAVTANNDEATLEPGEPEHYTSGSTRSLWWKWTAPASGSVEIHTNGSSFDTVLAVYTGNIVSNLTLIDEDDDSGDGTASMLIVPAAAGTVLRIAVASYGSDSGPLTLTVQPVQENDLFSSRRVLTGNSVTSAAASTFYGRESGEPAHAGDRTSPTAWWSWTPAVPGLYRMILFSGDAAGAAVYRVPPGGGLTQLQPVAMSDGNEMTFGAVAGHEYAIALAGSGTLDFSLSEAFGTPPVNDEFRTAFVIPAALPQSVSASNSYASRGEGEPPVANNIGSGTVWWKWTPLQSRDVQITTAGSSFDTTLAVFDGNDLDSLILVARNNDHDGTSRSRVNFAAVAGTIYHIVADGLSGERGDLILRLAETGQRTLLPFGSAWSWLHPLNGVDPAIADTDFNSTWMRTAGYNGPAFNPPAAGLLGFGGIEFLPEVTDIGTPVGFPGVTTNNRAAWFRRSFTLSAGATVSAEVVADDGAHIYVDGQRLASVGLTGTSSAFNVLTGTTGPENNSRVALLGALSAGTHEIGVSVHQTSATSTDLGFDLRLFVAAPPPGPALLVTGGVGTGFQEAPVGLQSYVRGSFGSSELGFTATAGAVAEAGNRYPAFTGTETFGSPGIQSFVINDVNAVLRTDAVDTRGFVAIAGSASIRTYTTSNTGFEAPDNLRASLETSSDTVAWVASSVMLPQRTGGTPDNLISLTSSSESMYFTFSSVPLTTPVRYVRITVSGVNDSDAEYFVIDNLRITGQRAPDADGDGFTSDVELWFGTSDTNAAQSPAPAYTFIPGTGMRITFPTRQGARYGYEYSDNLLSWTRTFFNAGAGTSSTVTDAGSVNRPSRFYRLLLP